MLAIAKGGGKMSVISAIGCLIIGIVFLIAGIIGVYVNRNKVDPFEITGPFMCGWDDDDDYFCGYVC
jgi:hypothetical protein